MSLGKWRELMQIRERVPKVVLDQEEERGKIGASPGLFCVLRKRQLYGLYCFLSRRMGAKQSLHELPWKDPQV